MEKKAENTVPDLIKTQPPKYNISSTFSGQLLVFALRQGAAYDNHSPHLAATPMVQVSRCNGNVFIHTFVQDWSFRSQSLPPSPRACSSAAQSIVYFNTHRVSGAVVSSVYCATETLKKKKRTNNHYDSKVHVFGDQLTSEKK